ncbi:Protein Ycf2 [Camellia lanceoleosa]|uniref:Protein Ycf2 n=1 Tax=Camellia lanceoleosa TaxID=1840588 RepID=A0ACC0GLK3_9ERIC|nr:Protein Ycf2 [Camellia lanceoleosa]
MLVKYLATNSYVPFITVFLNKFLDNKPKGFLIDDIDIDDSDDIDASDDINRDLDTKLLTMMNALTMDMMSEID